MYMICEGRGCSHPQRRACRGTISRIIGRVYGEKITKEWLPEGPGVDRRDRIFHLINLTAGKYSLILSNITTVSLWVDKIAMYDMITWKDFHFPWEHKKKKKKKNLYINTIYSFKGVFLSLCNATCKKTVWVIIISNYVPTGCNKCLIYNGFYYYSLITPVHGKIFGQSQRTG